MKIGLIGLGKMGSQIAMKLAQNGHELVVTDINADAVAKLSSHENIEGVQTQEELIDKLERKIVWLMIPSKNTGPEINKLLEILPEGALIIDGGNSDFRLTLERARTANHKGITLMDVGISGGISGFENGFSIMVGGPNREYEEIKPLIQVLAQKDGYSHFGKTGAGHFIKMVHNGIEYGMMEAYAEGYEILKENGEFNDVDLAKVATVWQNGSIVESRLNQLASEFFEEDQELSDIEGRVSETGEARWALEFAKDKKIFAPVIQSAFDRRIQSQDGKVTYATKFLAKLRNAFGGHSTTNVESSDNSDKRE